MSGEARRALVLAVAIGFAVEPVRGEEDPAVRALASAVTPERARVLLALARASVASTAEGRPLPAIAADDAPRPGCGVFVTLISGRRGASGGRVRGCYGDLNASDASLEEAVRAAALGAAARDIRSLPIRPDELDGLTIVLSLTLGVEPVADWHSVDPDRYGILVEGGAASAVLLPGEARTASWGLDQTMRKAGLAGSTPVLLSRFRTITFAEIRAR